MITPATFPGMSFADRLREHRIARHAKRALAAPTVAEAKPHFDRMFDEVRKRSPEQVARMEAALGLSG